MKKLLFISCLCIAGMQSFAQRGNGKESHPFVYLGLSTGLNNPSGVLGVDVDIAVHNKISVNAGVGVSSWGYKYFGEGKYYFSTPNRGLALGLGITHNTGFSSIVLDNVETTLGKQSVDMNYQPVTNMMFSIYKYWTMGKRNNRFHLQTGYSVRIDGGAHPYSVNNGYTLSTSGRRAMDILAPDGLIVALGFSFALDNPR